MVGSGGDGISPAAPVEVEVVVVVVAAVYKLKELLVSDRAAP
jgi:hypothetical protein